MINLLPPSYKEELLQEENRKLIIILGMVFWVFLISLILILFSVKLYIQGQLESVKVLVNLEEKTSQTPEIQKLKEEINSENKNLAKLSPFYGKQVGSVGILEKIFKTLPKEIYLKSFSWQKSTSQVRLSGVSPDRETLYNFQKNLEQNKDFTEINFPTQNWIKSTDIDFNVTFKLVQ